MLVLTRKEQEAIIIGPDVRITVLEVSGGRVRIGVSAPRHVPVLRQELALRIASETTVVAPVAAPMGAAAGGGTELSASVAMTAN